VLLDPTPDWDALRDWMTANSASEVPFFDRMHQTGMVAVNEIMKFQERGAQDEWLVHDSTRDQAASAFPASPIAVTQIIGAAGKEMQAIGRDKVQFFESWLKQHIPQGKQVLALESGHAIFAAQPQLVIGEIRKMVRLHRSGSSGD